MATPSDLRAWAAALRRWAKTVRDSATVEAMRKLADDLDKLAAGKDCGLER